MRQQSKSFWQRASKMSNPKLLQKVINGNEYEDSNRIMRQKITKKTGGTENCWKETAFILRFYSSTKYSSYIKNYVICCVYAYQQHAVTEVCIVPSQQNGSGLEHPFSLQLVIFFSVSKHFQVKLRWFSGVHKCRWRQINQCITQFSVEPGHQWMGEDGKSIFHWFNCKFHRWAAD